MTSTSKPSLLGASLIIVSEWRQHRGFHRACRNHALAINVVLFGLAHYLYGSPPGVVGAMMTGFLAWLLGRSLLETKGLLWPWFMHFLPDVVIFASYALAWVRR